MGVTCSTSRMDSTLRSGNNSLPRKNSTSIDCNHSIPRRVSSTIDCKHSGLNSMSIDLLLSQAQLEEQLRDDQDIGSPLAYDHGWDPEDCSVNITVMDDHQTMVRKHVNEKGSGGFLSTLFGQTDMVRGKRGYMKGTHMWEINWPQDQRGTHAVIGVATTDAPLNCTGRQSLLGSNDQSLGWDITHNKAVYNECVMKSYPEGYPSTFKAPEDILVILDMNEGTLKFKDAKSGEQYGVCLSCVTHFQRVGVKLYPAISCCNDGTTVNIHYVGDTELLKGKKKTTNLAELTPGPYPSGDYSFHSRRGTNVTLSNNEKTANRSKGFDKGVVLTATPLKTETLFEVRIDEKYQILIPNNNSLAIGVPSNDPDSLNLPTNMTDVTQGQTWMFSGCYLLHNGKRFLDLSNIDLDDLEEGQLLGLVVSSEGEVCLFIDGYLKEKCSIPELPSEIFGVIDLFGKVEQATLVERPNTENQGSAEGSGGKKTETEEILGGLWEKLQQLIQNLGEKDPAHIGDIRECITEHVEREYGILREETQRQLFAEKFADLGGAEALTTYLEFLILQERDQKEASLCFRTIQINLFSLTQDSIKFANCLGNTSFYTTMIEDIKKLIPLYKENKISAKILVNWLAIMNNCTEAVETRETLCEVGSVPILKDLLTSDYHDDPLLLLTLSTLLNLIPDYEVKMLKVSKTVLILLCELLAKTAKKSASRLSTKIDFFEAGKSLTFTAYDLAKCIQDVANNCEARYHLVDLGVADILFKIIEKGSKCEKEISLDALWQLADYKTVDKLMALQDIDMVKSLRQLKGSDEEEVKQAATRLDVKLMELLDSAGYGGQRLPSEKKTEGCEYSDMCMRYIASLGIIDDFMEEKFTVCYCASCHAFRGDQNYYTRGYPPQDYGLPIGWFRIGVKTPPRAVGLKAFEKWHRAYHGTSKEAVKKILEVGGLVIPGATVLGGGRVGEREGHFKDGWKPDGFDTKQIFLSPSIRYAGRDAYATPARYEDSSSDKVYDTRIALQVLIEPKSYQVGKQTVGAKSQIDPKFSNQELEWSTKEYGSVIIYGLLVKLDEADEVSSILFSSKRDKPGTN